MNYQDSKNNKHLGAAVNFTSPAEALSNEAIGLIQHEMGDVQATLIRMSNSIKRLEDQVADLLGSHLGDSAPSKDRQFHLK